MNQRPAFTKIMREFFHSRICIPVLFASENLQYLRGKVLTLKSNLPERSWEVEIQKLEDGFWITGQGWKNFVEENTLKTFDFLVFRFVADARIRVIIFGPDGSEKMTQATQIEEALKKLQISPSCNIDSDESGGDSGDDLQTNNIIASFIVEWKHSMRSCLPIRLPVSKAIRSHVKESLKVKNMKGEVHDVRIYQSKDGRLGFGAGWPAFTKASDFINSKTYELQFIGDGDEVDLVKVIRKN